MTKLYELMSQQVAAELLHVLAMMVAAAGSRYAILDIHSSSESIFSVTSCFAHSESLLHQQQVPRFRLNVTAMQTTLFE